MKPHLVSVFMPTFNHARFVREAVESVIHQDYRPLRIVIRDDGSTDGTQDELLRLSKEHTDLLEVLPFDGHLGAVRSFNRILQRCDGEFLALTSGDDIWLPRKLTAQVSALHSEPGAVLCFSTVEVFDSESNRVLELAPSLPLRPLDSTDPLSFTTQLSSCATSILLRRSAAPVFGFFEAAGSAADWMFWAETLLQGRAIHLPAVLARYRRHPGNYSADRLHILSQNLVMLDAFAARYPHLRAAADSLRKSHVLDGIGGYLLSLDDKTFNTSMLQRAASVSRFLDLLATVGSELVRRLARHARLR